MESDKTRPRSSTLQPRTFVLASRDQNNEEIYGVRLGRASAQEIVHQHAQRFAEKYQKCRACRWLEVQVFRIVESAPGSNPTAPVLLGDYVAHTVGHSIVPGEFTKARIVRASDPTEIIKALVVEKFVRGELGDTFMPRQTFDALDDAANDDSQLAEALETWLEVPANAQLVNAG